MGELIEPLMLCNACLGSTDPDYQSYNFAVSGILLAIVGSIGLIGNIFVVKTYLHPDLAIQSTSIYIAALGFSDFFLVLTALFLFVLEAWRHHDYPFLAWLYVSGAPTIFPIAAIFQTSSVYFCVAAAVDCFLHVCRPRCFRNIPSDPKKAKTLCIIIFILCIFYNIPHYYELEKVECLDNFGFESAQICPTAFRSNLLYYTIYYTYMYTIFLAVAPLLLLIILNICVVYTVLSKGPSDGEEDDTVSLILVVFFFIFCNFTALLVNFLEMVVPDPNILVYLVDMSNLLVVVNGTANFFCYLTFGASFRRTLKKVVFGVKKSEDKRKELWLSTDETRLTQVTHSLL